MIAVGQMRVVGTILSALGLCACGSRAVSGEDGGGPTSNSGGDGPSSSGDSATPTAGESANPSDATDSAPTSDEPGTSPTDAGDGFDSGDCSPDEHDEIVCLDPSGGTTGSLTFGGLETSSESGGSSTGDDTGASEDTTTGGVECLDSGAAWDVLQCSDGTHNSVSAPVMMDGACCYMVTCEVQECGSGRPFVIDRESRVAAPQRRGDWSDVMRVDVDGMSAQTRAELARAWLGDAQAEHASIASFARFALELMSIGAPPELIADAHAAAQDEIEHARICYALASAYADALYGPSALAMTGALDRCGDLYAIIRATVEEGCVGETLAAIEAEAAVQCATDPVVRAALTRIAADEARHAALAWRVVTWALGTGAPSVRRAVLDGLAAGEAALGQRVANAPPADNEGRLGSERHTALMRSAWREVLAPIGRELLAA